MCCFQEYMLLLLLILFSSLLGKHSTHPRTLKTSMGHFQDPKIDTSLKSELAGTKMWVTQREDLLQKLKQQTNKPPRGFSLPWQPCFSTVKSRRQPVFSLLPPFGHFVSAARFAFRTSLIVFALTRYKNILSRCVWVSASNVAGRRVQHKREALKLLKLHKICGKMDRTFF